MTTTPLCGCPMFWLAKTLFYRLLNNQWLIVDTSFLCSSFAVTYLWKMVLISSTLYSSVNADTSVSQKKTLQTLAKRLCIYPFSITIVKCLGMGAFMKKSYSAYSSGGLGHGYHLLKSGYFFLADSIIVVTAHVGGRPCPADCCCSSDCTGDWTLQFTYVMQALCYWVCPHPFLFSKTGPFLLSVLGWHWTYNLPASTSQVAGTTSMYHLAWFQTHSFITRLSKVLTQRTYENYITPSWVYYPNDMWLLSRPTL